MGIFRTKVWWWGDIGLLKWSSLLFGMIAGAWLADFVKQNLWIFVVIAIALAIRPGIAYFQEDA
jgi:hypothetical protein